MNRPSPKWIGIRVLAIITVVVCALGGILLVSYFSVATTEIVQKQWLVSFCGCLLLDMLIVQPVRIVLEDFLVPQLIDEKINRLKNYFQRIIVKMDEYKLPREKFQWSLMMYASARVASIFYLSRISELIYIVSLNSPRRSNTIHQYSNAAIVEKTVSSRRMYYLDNKRESPRTIWSILLYLCSRWFMKWPLLRNVAYDFISCFVAGGAMILQVRLYVEFGYWALTPSVVIGVVLVCYLCLSLLRHWWNSYQSSVQRRRQRLRQERQNLQPRTDIIAAGHTGNNLNRVNIDPLTPHTNVFPKNIDNQNGRVLDFNEFDLAENIHNEFDIPVAAGKSKSRTGRVQPLAFVGDFDDKSSEWRGQDNADSNGNDQIDMDHDLTQSSPHTDDINGHYNVCDRMKLSDHAPHDDNDVSEMDLSSHLDALIKERSSVLEDDLFSPNSPYEGSVGGIEDEVSSLGSLTFNSSVEMYRDQTGKTDQRSKVWQGSSFLPGRSKDMAEFVGTIVSSSDSNDETIPVRPRSDRSLDTTLKFPTSSSVLGPAPSSELLKKAFKNRQKGLPKIEEYASPLTVRKKLDDKKSGDSSSSLLSGISRSRNVDNAFYLSPASGNKKPRQMVTTSRAVSNRRAVEENDDDDDIQKSEEVEFDEKLSMIDSVLSSLNEVSKTLEKKGVTQK